MDNMSAGTRLVAAIQELSYLRDVTGVMEVVRVAARDLSGADGVTIVLRESDSVYYADENAIAPLWKGRRFPATSCISGWAMAHRQSVAIEDIYADPRIPADEYQPTFVKSLAIVPVRKEEPIAAIGAYWASRHLATAEELGLLESLASATSVALMNAELYSEAKKAVQARDDFMDIAAHELRNPMTPLQLYIRLLEEKFAQPGNEAASRTILTKVDREVRKLGWLVDNLLDISRVIHGVFPLERRLVNLGEIVHGVVESVQGEIAASKSAVVLSVESDLVGSWDPMRIEQVVRNLLTNAIKFGKGEPIDVTARGEADCVTLIVKDRGIGISPDNLSRVFGKFERAVSNRYYGGFGLGLWIARQVVEAHGGTIVVTSEPGHGSIFSVRLPTSRRD